VVVFDLGGVLIDWNPRHLYRKLIADPDEMERFLGTVTTTEWHGLQDRGGDPVEATRRLRAAHPAEADLVEAFYGRFDEMLEHDFPEMTALVERLAAAGLPLYLLSNAPAFLDDWARDRGRDRHPFLGRFRDYVVSGRVGLMKPDAAIYDLVCRTGGFAPGDAVFIDDSPANVEGARAAGLAAVHHRRPAETVAALRALGLPA
jgi:2-haloacid dehalogenase